MLGTKILVQASLAPQINIPSMTLTHSSPIPEYSPGKAMVMDCHPFLRSSSSTWPHSPQPVPRVKTLSECHRCVCTHKHTHTHMHTMSNIYTQASVGPSLPVTRVSWHLPPAPTPTQPWVNTFSPPARAGADASAGNTQVHTHSCLNYSGITYCCKPSACKNAFSAQDSPTVMLWWQSRHFRITAIERESIPWWLRQ